MMIPGISANTSPCAWETGDDRCPVTIYQNHATLKSVDFRTPDSPFSLATNSKPALNGDCSGNHW